MVCSEALIIACARVSNARFRWNERERVVNGQFDAWGEDRLRAIVGE
ncbi:MAG TPA: hypothetical protein VGS10_04920 [Terracidiphilus sp.]|nr:hypothetical protein [Terracidiphilus sp.]